MSGPEASATIVLIGQAFRVSRFAIVVRWRANGESLQIAIENKMNVGKPTPTACKKQGKNK
jgi:hypothetical protein